MTERKKPQPGPWTASEMTMSPEAWAELNEGHALTIVQTNWDMVTGDVVAAVWCDDDHDELATAHLIAAAPDMCEALVEVRRRFGLNTITRAMIDDALAKARGES